MAMSLSIRSLIFTHLLSTYYVLSHARSVWVIPPSREENSLLKGKNNI